MIRYDYAAKHDTRLRRRSMLARFWRFMTHRDPLAGESPLETIAAGICTCCLIAVLVLLAFMVGGGS